MKPSRGWTIAIMLVVVALIMLGSVGQAAESPPAPSVPDASRCHVAGRTPEQLEDLRAFVVARGAWNPISPAPTALPDGPPADPATRAAIDRMVDTFFACIAAGQPDRAYLLTSNALLTRFIDDPEEAVEYAAGLAVSTPLPDPPGERARYAGPWEVRQLADDRVSAAVWLDSEDEHPARGVTAIWFFVFEDGQWRLDETMRSIYVPATPVPEAKKTKRRSVAGQEVNVADLLGWPEIEPRAATPAP